MRGMGVKDGVVAGPRAVRVTQNLSVFICLHLWTPNGGVASRGRFSPLAFHQAHRSVESAVRKNPAQEYDGFGATAGCIARC